MPYGHFDGLAPIEFLRSGPALGHAAQSRAKGEAQRVGPPRAWPRLPGLPGTPGVWNLVVCSLGLHPHFNFRAFAQHCRPLGAMACIELMGRPHWPHCSFKCVLPITELIGQIVHVR
eukprot:15478572-Alexandrium_andersonii.AAC.1